MSYTYINNVSPQDRFDQFNMQRDNGSSLLMRVGLSYDLSPTELARARQRIVLVDSNAVAQPGGGSSDGGNPHWGAPVATKTALDAVTGMSAGDVRAVIADETQSGVFAIYGYTGSAWQLAAGAGGGGGGGTVNQIDISALLTGIQTGNTVVYDTSHTRFAVGSLTPE